MAIWSVFDPIAKLVKGVGDIIDNVSTTEEEKLTKKNELTSLVNEFQSKVLEHEVEMAKQQASVILAEANGKSWLQRNWRPLLMVVFMAILVNNMILLPYVPGVQPLEFPAQFWVLLTVGVGGYIGARTYDKKQATDQTKPAS
jgi:hypothetical protein